MKRKSFNKRQYPYEVRSEGIAFGVNQAATMEVAEKIAEHCRGLGYEATIHTVETAHQNHIAIGVQEPPQSETIFNRRQLNGTFRPLSEFFTPSDTAQ